MYNRYIPQSDGSYQRNRISEPTAQKNAQQPQASVKKEAPPNISPPKHDPTDLKQCDSITGFLKNLLPKNMDTGDLIIILLLLLLANDCEKDRNHALLTLALYFFL